MKPRLESRQFTNQDVEAMCHVSRLLMLRHGPGAATRWLIATAEADRRDAELMYRIEVCRQYEREHPSRFGEYAGLGWVHCLVATTLGGRRVGFTGSDITYCA